MYTTIGSYIIEERQGLFRGEYRNYYKNGQLVASSDIFGLRLESRPALTCTISRAQAYRYWKKHMPDLVDSVLPDIMQAALTGPCKVKGYYKNRAGEVVAYEG